MSNENPEDDTALETAGRLASGTLGSVGGMLTALAITPAAPIVVLGGLVGLYSGSQTTNPIASIFRCITGAGSDN